MSAEPVLTLADLENWERQAPSLAVLGHPISHSISPPMHNAALAALAREDARFAQWSYHRFDVAPDELPRALESLHSRGFHGINLTLPHKVIAFDLVGTVDPAARPAGAVNTLLRTPAGWTGFNTDGYGLAAAVRESMGLDLAGAPILLLGAGGAARAAAAECLSRRCAGLWIANRTPENLHSLLQIIRPLAGEIPISAIEGISAGDRLAQLPTGAIVINATSSGLRPSDLAPVDLERLPRPAGLYDMIYNPPETPLLRQARALGIPRANGLLMLAHQGAKSLEIWTGAAAARTAPVMLAAARAALAS